MAEGIILIGHGSRQEEANEEIRIIAQMVAKQRQGVFCETAFLTLARPDLSEATEKLVGQGVNKIIVSPVFLVTGNHMVQDIPAIIEELKTLYPDVSFYMAAHIGTHPGIAEILQERIQVVLDQF